MAKESISQEDDIKREFNFATHSIISQVLRGVFVGIFAGLVVGIFRFLIEKIFHLVHDVYHRSQQSMLWFTGFSITLCFHCFAQCSLGKVREKYQGVRDSAG